MSERPSFFAELRRRNVYKVARRLRDCWLAPGASRNAGFPIPGNPKLGRAIGYRVGHHRISDRTNYRVGV